jgi:hypothetical protein
VNHPAWSSVCVGLLEHEQSMKQRKGSIYIRVLCEYYLQEDGVIPAQLEMNSGRCHGSVAFPAVRSSTTTLVAALSNCF